MVGLVKGERAVDSRLRQIWKWVGQAKFRGKDELYKETNKALFRALRPSRMVWAKAMGLLQGVLLGSFRGGFGSGLEPFGGWAMVVLVTGDHIPDS